MQTTTKPRKPNRNKRRKKEKKETQQKRTKCVYNVKKAHAHNHIHRVQSVRKKKKRVLHRLTYTWRRRVSRVAFVSLYLCVWARSLHTMRRFADFASNHTYTSTDCFQFSSAQYIKQSPNEQGAFLLTFTFFVFHFKFCYYF